MKIEIEDYIVVSDPQCMWIEEKYNGETKDKKPKEYTRRITGYVGNFRQLMEVSMNIKSEPAVQQNCAKY